MEIYASSVVCALTALAHDHRLAVFRLLVEAGTDGLAAGEIAARLQVPASSLSFHLAHLEQSGLALRRRAGRSRIYSADFAAMRALIGYLTDNCCGGQECLTVPERSAA